MLRISELGVSIEGRPLLEGAGAVIPAGHKVGIVGPNGCGKTTLFRVIRGELTADAGRIDLPRGARIGGVAQEVPAGPESLMDVVLAADTERAELLAEAETATDPARIAEIHARLADIGAHSAEARAATILHGLGFSAADQARPTSEFSGGWRMRVALAGVLFSAPDLLLLDEPTNYLDLEGAMWLEAYIARYPHTALVISHDRNLLNRAVGHILHLHNRKLTLYSGGYDQFESQRAARLAHDAALARQAQARRAHLQSFVDRFRYKASKARQAQARLKMIERLPVLAVERDAAGTRFSFPQPDELPPPLLDFDDVAVGYDGQPVLRRMRLQITQDSRIALLGANGQGKSTLAKLIAGQLRPLSGELRRARKLRVGYFAQHQLEALDPRASPIAHLTPHFPDEPPARLRARLAGFGLTGGVAETPAARLSGGQRARLSLMLATLDAPHVLVLDEPTNHLDIDSRRALAEALAEFRGAVILVSHDLSLLELCADELWLVSNGKVSPYTGTLEEYRERLLAERSASDAVGPGRTGAGQAQTRGRKAGQRATRTAARAKTADKAAHRRRLIQLRAELARCEGRLEKLGAMRAAIERELADPATYAVEKRDRLSYLQTKSAELKQAEQRAEELWMEAQMRLDEATSNVV